MIPAFPCKQEPARRSHRKSRHSLSHRAGLTTRPHARAYVLTGQRIDRSHRRQLDSRRRILCQRASPERPLNHAEERADILLCAKQRYYTAQDLDPQERPGPVQQLYAPTARVTWNGNPIAYADLPAFVQQMPKSAHEVQAFDCHPISGAWGGRSALQLRPSETDNKTSCRIRKRSRSSVPRRDSLGTGQYISRCF